MSQPVALEGSSEWSTLNTPDGSIWILLHCDCGVGSLLIVGRTKSLVENTELSTV